MIDETFISELYEEMAPVMKGWLVARKLDASLAEDLVQEAFIRAWNHRESIRDNRNEISGLLWTILKRIHIDYYRRSRNEIATEDIATLPESDEPVQKLASSDADVIVQCVNSTLAKLPSAIVETWKLFQYEELSIKEISARTGASETLVKVRIHRAKTRLREALIASGLR